MKTIEIPIWINRSTINREEPTVSTIEPGGFDKSFSIEGKAVIDIPTFSIKLLGINRGGKNYYHLLADRSEEMSYENFMSILSTLKKAILPSNRRLNWSIYSGQPIWEFNEDPEVIKQYIEENYIEASITIQEP